MQKITGKVLEVTALSDRITAFGIGAVDGAALPDFEAGAHVQFDLPEGDTRSYSLISFDAQFDSPTSYRIAVQREDGGAGGSRFMHRLSVGDTLSFSAPINDFPVDISQPAVLVAGGIGITPMISMASALSAADQQVSMIFAGRSEHDMAYTRDLQALLGAQLRLHFDDRDGALDLDAVIASLDAAQLYVCGPRGMIDGVRAKAEAAGIAPERVHFELFEAVAAEAGDTAFDLQINDGRVFTIPAGKTIIDVLEENDVDVMYDCQRGDCGICQCDVLEGVPDHRDVVLSEAERASGEVMQICVSRAKSARLILDI